MEMQRNERVRLEWGGERSSGGAHGGAPNAPTWCGGRPLSSLIMARCNWSTKSSALAALSSLLLQPAALECRSLPLRCCSHAARAGSVMPLQANQQRGRTGAQQQGSSTMAGDARAGCVR